MLHQKLRLELKNCFGWQRLYLVLFDCIDKIASFLKKLPRILSISDLFKNGLKSFKTSFIISLRQKRCRMEENRFSQNVDDTAAQIARNDERIKALTKRIERIEGLIIYVFGSTFAVIIAIIISVFAFFKGG